MFLEKKGLKKLLLLQALIGGGSPAVERIALGNPLTFGTDLAKPLVSLEIPFTPIQEGSGDPSPSNIRNILPWNGLTVFGGGKNLLNVADRQSGYISSAGVVVLDNTNVAFGYVFLKANTAYTVSTSVRVENIGTCLYETDKTTVISRQNNVQRTSITIPADTKDRYLRIWINYDGGTELNKKTDSEIVALFAPQIEAGSTATAYEPYHPITDTDIVFQSPVYGGQHEAVSGKLMNGWKVETLDDVNAWTDGGTFISYSNHVFTDRKVGDSFIGVCSAFPIKNNVPSGTAYMRWGGVDAPNILIAPNGSSLTLEDVKTLSGQGEIVLCYPLATPTEQTLTGHQITALVGNNTIWSDADGSMTCVYLVSSKYADEHPVGGLGFGFGSGTPAEPDDPENPDESEEPIIDDSENNQTEGEEP